MAKKTIDDSYLTGIGQAIRSKTGGDTFYKPSQMASAINSIPTYPEPTGSISINANGLHNVKSYATATVNVPNSYDDSDEGKVVSSGALVAQTSTTKTSNGTYDTTTNDEVVINVPNTYSASDEGKVVDNGALVVQSSQTVTENGTYDTTLKNEVVVNVEGGGDVYVDVDDYAFDFTPNKIANRAVSGGIAFITSKRIKVSKLRVWPRETTASAYISQGNTNIASVVNATVVANQWNDLTLSEPVTLEPNVTYVVWYSMPNYACRYYDGVVSSDRSYISYVQGRYSTSVNTIPTSSENTAFGVDFYIDSYEQGQAVLISKNITQNGTYNASDDDADGYDEVSVNVSSSSGVEVPLDRYAFDFAPTSTADMANKGGIAFTTSKKIKVSKLRVLPRGTTASAYISQGNTNIASVVNATVVANQWNDLTLSEPVTLEPNVTYVVWYYTPNYTVRYAGRAITPSMPFINYIGGRYGANTSSSIPASQDNNSYGVDFCIDSYETQQVALVPKVITKISDTYYPIDDNADGYSKVVVSVDTQAMIDVDISVTGGYNGGAVISILFDGVEVFTAVGTRNYNLDYDIKTATISTVYGNVSIQVIPPANSTSDLKIIITGESTITENITYKGNNTSYGYDYHNSRVLKFYYELITVQKLTQAEWNALTTAQKQSMGLVAIEQSSSGFNRGILVNGADYTDA